MFLLKLAWKNVWRNKQRSLITMSSIFCAVVLAILTTSLQDGIFDNLTQNVVSFHSGYLQIHKNGYWEEQILDNGMRVSRNLEDSVLQLEGVHQLTPRLESFMLASSNEVTKGCLVSGIMPEKENVITNIKSKLLAGDYLTEKEPALLIAEGLANDLDLHINDTLILIGQGYHGAMAVGKFPIKGILKFGSPELNDQAVYLPLVQAQDLFGAYDIITTYVLSITSPSRLSETTEKLKATISNQYEVMTWEEIVPAVAQHIKTDKASMYIIIGFLYLLIVFGVFGTQLMMMIERQREISMLVAIGMTKIKLIGSMLIESVLSVLVGCLLGIGISVPIVFYLNKYPIQFSGDTAKAFEQFGFEPIFPTSTEAIHFWSQALVVLIIGLVLSLYPVYRIIRLDTTGATIRR